MKASRFQWILGAALLAIFAAVWVWQQPGLVQGKLTAQEVDRYMAVVERLPFPAEEGPMIAKRVRAWAAADDGQPFYMINLMRYHDKLRAIPGAPDFKGTPRESNALYEEKVMPLALKSGVLPLFGGDTQGGNVLDYQAELDNWSRVMVVRYSSRRAFLDLITDPAYAPILPYKLMAFRVVLTPAKGELMVPDLRFIAGAALLAVFLLVGWVRAARRAG